MPLAGSSEVSKSLVTTSASGTEKAAKPNMWSNFCTQLCKKLKSASTGCDSCGFKCLSVLQQNLDRLQAWRVEFSSLPKEIADRELLWIFQKVRPADAPQPQAQGTKRVLPETSISTEETSVSGEDAKAEGQEVITSQSESSSDRRKQKTKRHGKGSLQHRGFKSAASRPDRRPRRATKQPSVILTGVIDGFSKVCFRTALFALGIGNSRLQRETWQQ